MRHKLLVSLRTEETSHTQWEMKLKWMKVYPYNHKGTKIDGVEPKHRGTPATKKEDYLISRCVSSLQFRDSVIQLPEH